MGFDIATGQVSSVTISGSKSKGKVDANSTSYNESTLKADKNLDFTSGKDTNIKGGKLSGEKVTGNAGKDLNIESKQDKNSYKEKNSSAGFGVGIDLSGKNKKDGIITTDKKDKASNANKAGIFGSAIKSNVDSNYNSVTDQSGIYAGKEGFDINVGENTDLKGGIISSEAAKDKNKISTGTLTYEDIKNEADYKAGGAGIKVNKNNDAEYNEKGITPDIGMPASGEAESTTKAAISEGTIEIRDKENQKQDIEKLNRDTNNSLNKLGEIFDKTKIEERQELANLFGELAYNEIHYMDGSNEQKALYHAVVGGIMSKLTGGDFLAGATAAGINKLVIEEIVKVADGDPDKAQWVSAVLGAVISDLVSGNTQAGASVDASATKNNEYGARPLYSKQDGAYIYVPGEGWYVVVDGKDVYTQETPPEGVPYWQKDEGGNLGWDYIRHDRSNQKIDDKILYCKYIMINNKAYGVTVYEYNDNTKKAIIKNGMTMLAGALLAKNANSFDSIDALFNNIDPKDGLDYKSILKGSTIENISNYLSKVAGR